MSNEKKPFASTTGAVSIEKEGGKTTVSVDSSPKGATAGVAAGATVGAALGPGGEQYQVQS